MQSKIVVTGWESYTPVQRPNVRLAPKSVIEASFAIARKRTSCEMGNKSRLCHERTSREKLDRLLAFYGEDAAECRAIYAELLSLDLGDGFDLQGLSAQQRKEITLRAVPERT